MGYNEEQLGAIADAIRAITGQTDKIKATEFANIIKTFNGPTFEVKYNLQNLTSDGKSFGVMNKDYVATLTPAQYHEVPETVEIAIGGVTATQGAEYTYINGIITIFGNKITGHIEINANGVKSSYDNVKIINNPGSDPSADNVYYYVNDGAQQTLSPNASIILNDVYKLSILVYGANGYASCKITDNTGKQLYFKDSSGEISEDITQYLQDSCTISLYADD